MSVVRSIKDTGAHRKELEIEVPVAALQAETDRVVEQYRHGVRLPGFRKGKAPKSMIAKRFGGDIDKEVLDRLVPRYCHQALSESEIEPLMNPRVEKVEHESGESLSFVASVEIRPQIELAGVDSLNLPEAEVEPRDDEQEEALAKLRRDVAPWAEVERSAAQGDLVTAEIREVGEGAEAEAPAQEVPFEIGDSNVWEELSLAATGLNIGQSGTFERKEPAEEGEEGPQVRKFEITVTKVSEKDLPELDDALAAKVGPFETLDALKEQINVQLRSGKEQERSRARENSALEQLVTANPLDLPEGVVQHENENLLREYAENIAQRGIDLETAEIDWARLRGELMPQAERRVHTRLLLDAAAKKYELSASPTEVEEMLAGIARVQKVSKQELRNTFEKDGRMESLKEDLARRKAIRFLIGELEEPAGDDDTPAEAPE